MSESKSSVQWGVIAAAYASLFALGIADNARGPLFPDILAELELGDATGSWMFGVTSAGVIVGSLGIRPVLTYVSARRVLQGSLLCLALALVGLGFSPSLVPLLVASLTMGIALGGLVLGQNLLVQQATPPALQRRAFSGLHSMYGVASLLAPLAVMASRRVGLGWRHVLFWLAVPSVLVAIGAQFVRLKAPAPTDSPSGESAPKSPIGWRVWTIAGMTGCCVVAELLLSTRIPLLLRRGGLSEETADLYLSGFFACLLIGRLVVTILPLDGISNRRLLLGSTVSSLALFALALSVEPRLLPLVALTLAPCFPVATALLAEEHGPDMERGMSVLMATTSLLLVIAHGGVGALSEQLEVLLPGGGEQLPLRAALWVGPLALAASLVLQAFNARLASRAEAAAAT